MGTNRADDGSTDLLVPATEVLWAVELILRANAPERGIEQALGFPLIALPAQLETVDKVSEKGVEPAVAGALPVLALNEASEPHVDGSSYGCALVLLWSLLVIVVLFIVISLATY